MAYTLKHRPDSTVEINASIEAEAVAAERRRILDQYRRKARIPGFRPGKVPISIIQARFGEAVDEDLTEELVKRSWAEVLEREEGLEPLSPLKVREARFDPDGGFELSAEVEVRPRWDLPEIAGQKLPEVSLEVTEAEIEEELEKVRNEQAVWEPAEGPAEDGMLVEVDIAGEVVDGEGEPFTEEGVRFVLGEEGVFEEIQEVVRGAAPGDELTAEKTFPEDHPDERSAGRTARYRVTVGSLKRKVLPEVDDELAEALGFDSLDALRERIREVLGNEKKKQRRQTWRRAILDRLEEGIDVNALPETLVRTVMREELSGYAYALAVQGHDPKDPGIDWQEISAKMEPEVRRRVLDELVLEQLADEWEIAVPEAEVEAYVAAEARRKGVPIAEHRANLEKEGRYENVRRAARIAVTVDEAIRRAGGEVD